MYGTFGKGNPQSFAPFEIVGKPLFKGVEFIKEQGLAGNCVPQIEDGLCAAFSDENEFEERNKKLSDGSWIDGWHDFCVSRRVIYKRVVKKEFRKMPIMGKTCELMGHIFIDRSNPMRAKHSLDIAKQNLFPFSYGDAQTAVDEYLSGGIRPTSHTKVKVIFILAVWVFGDEMRCSRRNNKTVFPKRRFYGIML